MLAPSHLRPVLPVGPAGPQRSGERFKEQVQVLEVGHCHRAWALSPPKQLKLEAGQRIELNAIYWAFTVCQAPSPIFRHVSTHSPNPETPPPRTQRRHQGLEKRTNVCKGTGMEGVEWRGLKSRSAFATKASLSGSSQDVILDPATHSQLLSWETLQPESHPPSHMIGQKKAPNPGCTNHSLLSGNLDSEH